MRPLNPLRTPATPTAARCFGILLFVFAAPAAGAELNEDEAVARALARPEGRDLVDGEVDLARADAVRSRLWPNPVLSWSREETRGGPAAATDQLAVVSQTLDLSGRRGLRSDAAARRVEVARSRGAVSRLVLEGEVRGRFHEALAADRRVAAFREALRRTDDLAAAVARRHVAGDASGYDRSRVDRERAGFAARLAVEEASQARARARLAALLGGGDLPPPAGDLLPASTLPPADAFAARVTSRADLRTFALEAEAGELEERVAGRGWLPELTLTGGYRGTTVAGERLDGVAVGISLPFPVFDRAQDEGLRGGGRRRAARARLALETQAALADVRALHAQAAVLTEAARRFRAEGLDAARRLAGTAAAAYRGGELAILDLVDAHRGTLDAELQAIELDLAARRARLDLAVVTGGFVP